LATKRGLEPCCKEAPDELAEEKDALSVADFAIGVDPTAFARKFLVTETALKVAGFLTEFDRI